MDVQEFEPKSAVISCTIIWNYMKYGENVNKRQELKAGMCLLASVSAPRSSRQQLVSALRVRVLI